MNLKRCSFYIFLHFVQKPAILSLKTPVIYCFRSFSAVAKLTSPLWWTTWQDVGCCVSRVLQAMLESFRFLDNYIKEIRNSHTGFGRTFSHVFYCI